MARLRYLQNKRSGVAGTISKGLNNIYFNDDQMYVGPWEDGGLDMVADDNIWLFSDDIYFVGDVHFYGDVEEHETEVTEFDVLLTDPTEGINAVHALIDTDVACTSGNLVAVRGQVEISGSEAIVSVTGVWAGIDFEDAIGAKTGLVCALNAEVSADNASKPNAIVYIQSLPGSGADFSNVPYLVFSETRSGTGSNILFEVGHSEAGTTPEIGEDELFYHDTLQIAVNESAGSRTPFFIPLSTDSGTFTTEYPIISSYVGVGAIQLADGGYIQFLDNAMYIGSTTDATLDIVSDGTVTLTGKFARTETIAVVDAGTTGRRSYWQFTASSIEAGEQLCGLQLRASWGGTADSLTGGITGIEIKARASGDSITHTVGTAKAIIANVDCKKSTFTTAWGVESQFDIASGGTITTGAAFRASLNNSGTFTTSYAFLVETANTSYNWNYGLYMTDNQADTGVAIGACSTANIAISGANVTGISMTGTYSTAGIYIATDMAAYNDYCIHIAAECDDISGNTILPLYVTADIDGTGGNGRAAEFVLAPTATMGHWGNAVKAKLDLSGSNGSVGLLAGVCAEVVTPATALAASTACVEHEIVATEGFTLGDFTGAPNTMNFMQFALGGNGTAVTEVDNHGQFMIINGLTALAGNMLSADSVTIKCAVNNTAEYLIFSTTENMIKYTTTVTSPASGDTVGEAIDVQYNYDGTGTSHSAGASFMTYLQDSAVIAPNYKVQAMTMGIDESGGDVGTVTDAHLIFGARMHGLIAGNDYNRFCPFSINTSNRLITAIFDIAAGPSIGIDYTVTEQGAPVGYVPLFVDPGGTVNYIRVYSSMA